MSTTKVPNFLITPPPPSAVETNTALDNKLNIADYNKNLALITNRLDTLESNNAISEYNIQLNTEYFSNRGTSDTYRMRIIKIGRICLLVGNMVLTQDTTSNISTVISSVDIPSAYLPIHEVNYSFTASGWFSQAFPRIRINIPANLLTNQVIQLGTIVYLSKE